MPNDHIKDTPKGFILHIKVTPKAKKVRITHFEKDSDSTWRLKVYVSEPPTDQQANEGVIALLSKTFKIAKSHFSIVSGASDRKKTIAIGKHAISWTDLEALIKPYILPEEQLLF